MTDDKDPGAVDRTLRVVQLPVSTPTEIEEDGRKKMLELLELARKNVESGEWSALAIAVVCSDRSLTTAWRVGGDDKGCYGNLLLGAVGHLSFRLNLELVQAFIEERESP